MIEPIRQHSRFPRPYIVADVAASASFTLGFILIVSEIVVWLIYSVEPDHVNGFPTGLGVTGLLALGLGAHLMDLAESSNRKNAGKSENARVEPSRQEDAQK